MTRRRHLALLLAPALLCAACASQPTRFAANTDDVRAATADLTSFVRAGWHLPLDVRVHLSNAEDGQPLAPEQAAREQALAVDQLAAVREAYAHTAFDIFEVQVDVGRVDAPSARVTGPTRRLEIALPAPGQAPGRPLEAHALIAAMGEAFAWDEVGAWYRGETSEELLAALRRDLGKLDVLEEQLALECRRLELVNAGLEARGAATGNEPTLTPSEATFARGAQFRATFTLHRVLNTIARWRVAAADEACSVRDVARVVLLRARYVHQAHLDWVLDIIVGQRPVLAVWQREWWHRHPLYKTLDAKASLDFVDVEGGAPPGSIPEGAVRALLKLRYDSDLDDCYEEIEELAEELTASWFGGHALEAELTRAWARIPASKKVMEAHTFTAFAAWKETWDARLKGGFTFPFYVVVAQVACFLGDTRTTSRPPAVTPAQADVLAGRLAPGDILVVRQDGFLSNAFLPGFWPHAVLWLGPEEAWTRLRLEDGTRLGDDPLVQAVLPRFRAATDEHGLPARSIEAVSEGVVFSSIAHALGKDYVAALRPELPEQAVAAAIKRALALHGRPYDFDFDFGTDDRVVCTELVYRAYDPELNFRVQVDGVPTPVPAVPGLMHVAGRLAMPANELARYVLHMVEHPEPAPALRYPGRKLRLLFFADRKGPSVDVHEGAAALGPFRGSVLR